jgi:hypothetical protein
MMREWVTSKGVVLRGGGLDESPHVYRRLPDVLAAQKLSAISYQLSARTGLGLKSPQFAVTPSDLIADS